MERELFLSPFPCVQMSYVPYVSKEAKPDLMKKLQEVPHKPGVYLHRDRFGTIIYVGKARDLRKRLAHYFTPSRQRLADHKTRALISSIWDFDIYEVRNEPEALLLEGKLIKEYRPKYNIAFRDDKRFLLLKIHPEEPWPRFQLVRLKKDDGARYFGPFVHSGALRGTLAWINKEFGLRSCRPLIPTEQDYRHCHDDIIKNCSAPCMGRITREAYMERVDRACALLEGSGKEYISAMEDEMREAAMGLDFERAAELRDMIANLKQTLRPTRQFRRQGTPGDAINPQEDVAELGEILSLERLPRVMECFDISNISDNHIVASMVRFRDGLPDRAGYRRYRIRSVEGQNDFASMAEVIRRRYSRVLLEARAHVGEEEADETQETPYQAMRRIEEKLEEPQSSGSAKPGFVRLPDLVIVDGGKGQLGMAMKELQRLGLSELPVAGLAEKHEELYLPGRSDPLIIPHERGALKLLQRIRDEAHRFANGYHQILMKRRIEESILDDCPGISQSRKERLLQKFGSVTRLRKATSEQIAELPGFGKKLALEIVEFLKTH